MCLYTHRMFCVNVAVLMIDFIVGSYHDKFVATLSLNKLLQLRIAFFEMIILSVGLFRLRTL